MELKVGFMRFLPLMFGAVLLVGPATGTVISVSPTKPIGPWGGSGFATFGQTITAPVDSQLLDFTFLLGKDVSGLGPTHFQAHVYAWDAANSRAMGSSLYSSATSTFTAPDSGYTEVKFSPNITLTPNAQYVLFFSTAGLDVATPYSAIPLGLNELNPYSGGQMFIQNSNLAADWTTFDWLGDPGSDFAMTVNFADSGVPEPSTYGLCGAALAALGLLRRKRVAKG